MSTDLTETSLERPATRADLARHLLARVERLSSLLGTIPLATEVQLLKRDLSRGHGVLRTADETNFLSVVTLVESALACLTWKQIDTVGITLNPVSTFRGEVQCPFLCGPSRGNVLCPPPGWRPRQGGGTTLPEDDTTLTHKACVGLYCP